MWEFHVPRVEFHATHMWEMSRAANGHKGGKPIFFMPNLCPIYAQLLHQG